MNKVKRWTEDELAYLQRFWGRFTPQKIAARISKVSGNVRSPHACQLQAHKHFLTDNVPNGYTRLSWAYGRNQHGASARIIRAAKRAGVAKRQDGARNRPWMAPTTWVDQYVNTINTEPPEDYSVTEIRTTWVTSKQAERLFNLRGFASRILTSRRSWLKNNGHHLRYYRDVTAAGKPVFWHPDDIRDLHRRYVAYRAKSPVRATFPRKDAA